MGERIDIYYDFACPWAWGGQVWIDQVREAQEDGLTITWKYFPLEQVNAKDPNFKVWEQPNDGTSSTLRSFQAQHAAGKQGADAATRFRAELFRKRHVDGRNLSKQEVLEAAAVEAGLDIEQFRIDLASDEVFQVIRDNYEEARRLGVFGTPTYMFENGEGAYLQVDFRNLPSDPVEFWNEFVTTVRDRPEVREIKRPQPPRS
jgi:predicted DsbA family dithiol-disulfide isomerase